MQDKKSKTKKQVKVKNTLLKVLLVTMVAVISAFGYNIYSISNKEEVDETLVDDNKETVKYSNTYYSIGNNPIEINKEYFLELNEQVELDDKVQIAVDVVKVFITEYYTWTNKDGNYDVGGMQYIYTDRQSDFESNTRDNFYSEMDQYITLYGTSNLMQVSSVEANPWHEETITVLDSAGNGVEYPCVVVGATWTYEDCAMDLSSAQTSATFYVINHDGRMEIAVIQ